MYKINVIKNNNIIQVVNTDFKISEVLYKIHKQYGNNAITIEKPSLFEYNLIII